MTRLLHPLAPLTVLALATLAGCGGGTSERERLLEERLAEAEARAGRAESELAKARALLNQPAGGDAGAESSDDSGSGEADSWGDDAEFDGTAGDVQEAGPDELSGPN